jgi:myosin heavy subunit
MDFENTKVVVENIGGLKHIEADIIPGLNVIEQPNASGKTSFLRAFSLLLTPSGNYKDLEYILRSMSTEGFILITDHNGNQIKKTISRNKNTITVAGDDLVTPEISLLVKRFAICGHDNEILSAVRLGQNLKSLIGTDNNIIERLKAEIRYKESNLAALTEDLNKDANAAHQKISTEKKRDALLKELSQLEEKYAALKKQHDSMASVGKETATKEKLNAKSTELQQIEFKINDSKKMIKNKNELIEKLSKEIQSLRRSIEQLGEVDNREIDKIKKEMQNIDYKIQKTISQQSTLDMTIQATKNVVRELEESPQTNTILDSLSDDSHVSCPVCGQDAGIRIIKKHIDELMEKRAKTQTTISKLESDKAVLSKKQDILIQKGSEITTAISVIKSKEATINNENGNISLINQAIEKLEDSKEKLNAEIKELSKSINDKVVNITIEIAKIKESIGQKKTAIENFNNEIKSYDAVIRGIDNKRLSVAEMKKDVENTKAELHKIELRIQEQFNQIIPEVYSILGFSSNISRISLEQNYDLMVSRKTDKDSIYRDMDSIKTLSKSELEVIGLAVMISGYIVNNLKEYFPYILLDELTFLDNKRLKALMDYMEKIAVSIILTKLPPETEKIGQRRIDIASDALT